MEKSEKAADEACTDNPLESAAKPGNTVNGNSEKTPIVHDNTKSSEPQTPKANTEEKSAIKTNDTDISASNATDFDISEDIDSILKDIDFIADDSNYIEENETCHDNENSVEGNTKPGEINFEENIKDDSKSTEKQITTQETINAPEAIKNVEKTGEVSSEKNIKDDSKSTEKQITTQETINAPEAIKNVEKTGEVSFVKNIKDDSKSTDKQITTQETIHAPEAIKNVEKTGEVSFVKNIKDDSKSTDKQITTQETIHAPEAIKNVENTGEISLEKNFKDDSKSTEKQITTQETIHAPEAIKNVEKTIDKQDTDIPVTSSTSVINENVKKSPKNENTAIKKTTSASEIIDNDTKSTKVDVATDPTVEKNKNNQASTANAETNKKNDNNETSSVGKQKNPQRTKTLNIDGVPLNVKASDLQTIFSRFIKSEMSVTRDDLRKPSCKIHFKNINDSYKTFLYLKSNKTMKGQKITATFVPDDETGNKIESSISEPATTQKKITVTTAVTAEAKEAEQKFSRFINASLSLSVEGVPENFPGVHLKNVIKNATQFEPDFYVEKSAKQNACILRFRTNDDCNGLYQKMDNFYLNGKKLAVQIQATDLVEDTPTKKISMMKRTLLVRDFPNFWSPKQINHAIKQCGYIGMTSFSKPNPGIPGWLITCSTPREATILRYKLIRQSFHGRRMNVDYVSDPEGIEEKPKAIKRPISENASENDESTLIKKIKVEKHVTPSSTSTANASAANTSKPNTSAANTSMPNTSAASTSKVNTTTASTPNTNTSNVSTSNENAKSSVYNPFLSCKRQFWKPPDRYNEAFGLSRAFLQELGVTMPLVSRIRVNNVNEAITQEHEEYLRKVFSLAGIVKDIRVISKNPKTIKSYSLIVVEYDHPVEAIQAISMFHNRNLCGNQMYIELDNKSKGVYLPQGLESIGPGFGQKGMPLTAIRQYVELQPLKKALDELGKQVFSDFDRNKYFDGHQSTQEPVEWNQQDSNKIQNPATNTVNQQPVPNVLNQQAMLNQQAVPNMLNQQAVPNALNQQNMLLTMLGQTQMPTNDLSTAMQAQWLTMMQNMQALMVPQTNQMADLIAAQTLQAQPNFAQNSQAQANFAQNSQAQANFAQNSQAQANFAQNSQAQANFAQNSQAQANFAQNSQAQANFAQNSLEGQYNSGLPPVPSGKPPQDPPKRFGGLQSYKPGFNAGSNPQSEWNTEPKVHYSSGPVPVSNNPQNRGFSQGPSNAPDTKAFDTLAFSYLPPSVTTQALNAKMREVGEILYGEMTGLGRALVRFKNERDAERCLKLFNGSKVDGQVIKVKYMSA